MSMRRLVSKELFSIIRKRKGERKFRLTSVNRTGVSKVSEWATIIQNYSVMKNEKSFVSTPSIDRLTDV